MFEDTKMKTNAVANNQGNDLSKFGKSYLTGTYVDIFGDFDTELHGGKFFIHLYNELCYTYSIFANIDIEALLNQLNTTFNLTNDDYLLKDEQSKTKKIDKVDYTTSSYFIRVKDRILLEIHPYKAVFWYAKDITFNEIGEIIQIIEATKRKKKHRRKFYMVATSNRSEHGFELKKFNIKDIKVNIEQNYNDDFKKIDEIIVNFLNAENQNGLLLLHGKHGTGKTTYIRNIMCSINKPFIFLPLNLVESISAPSFLPFISKYKNSTLVLEDCEDLLVQRGTGNFNNNSLVNLLNLGDGLLSDALSFKIICTFNANLKQIDQAILRKGRLIARYEFKELEIPKVQQLYDILAIEEKADKAMTLAEIYNKNAMDFSDLSAGKKIGFGKDN